MLIVGGAEETGTLPEENLNQVRDAEETGTLPEENLNRGARRGPEETGNLILPEENLSHDNAPSCAPRAPNGKCSVRFHRPGRSSQLAFLSLYLGST